MRYYKCKKCNGYINIPIKYQRITILGITADIPLIKDDYYKDDIYCFFHLLLEKMFKMNKISYEDFNIQLQTEYKVICENCDYENEFIYNKYIADEYYFYISNYIRILVNTICIRHIGSSIKELDKDHSNIYYSIAKELPLKYSKEKKKLIRF